MSMWKSPPSWAVEVLLPLQQHIGAILAPLLISSGHPSGCLLAGTHADLLSACCGNSSSSGCSSDPRRSAALPAQLIVIRSKPDILTFLGHWRDVLQENKLQLAQHVEPKQQVARQQQHPSAAGPRSIWTHASHEHPAASLLSWRTSSSCHTMDVSIHSSCRTFGSMTHGGGSRRAGDRRARGSSHGGDSGVDEVEELQHSNRRRIQRSITRCKSLSQLSSILALYSPEFDAVHAATAAGMAARLCDGALQHHSTVTALNTILPLLHTHAPSLDLQGLGQSLSSLAELGLPRTHPTCILLLLQLRHRLCGDADSETKEVVSAAAAGSSAVGGKLAAVGRVWQSNGRGGGLWVDEVSGGRRNSRNSPGSSNPQAPVKLQAVAAVACALAVLDVSDVHLQLPLVRMAVAVVQADAHSAADREEEENDDLDDGDDREPSRRQRGKGMTGGAEYASPSTRVKHYRDLIWAFATLSASSGHHETSLGVTDQGSSTISEQQQQQEAAAMIGQVRSLTQRLCMTIAEEVEGVLESRGALRLPTLEVLMWGFATLGHNDSHLSTAAVVSGGSSWDSASKTTTGSAAGGGGRLSVRLAPVWEALCDAVHAHGDRVLVTQEQAANMLHSLALAARSMASVSEEALSSSGEAQRRRRRQREMLLPFRDLQPLLLRGLLHSGDGGGAGSRRGEVEGSTVGQPAELLAATAWAIAELAQAGAPCRRFSLDTASSPEQDVDESEDDEREEAVIGSVSWTAGALGPASVVQLLLAEACEDLEARGAVPVLVSCETGENTAVDGATGLGVGRVADAVGTSGESKGDVGSGIGEGLFVQMYEAQLWLWDTVGEEQTALAPDSVLQSCRTAYARTSA